MEKIKIENLEKMPDDMKPLVIVEKMQIAKYDKLKKEKNPVKKKLLQRDISLLQAVMVNLQTCLF